MRKIHTLKELQGIEYSMLLYVYKVAKKNNIKILLSGGTLLGAARHQGFIPWDDDIDVMLMRKDYNKLMRCLKKEKNTPYKLMTWSNTITYPLAFAKLIDTRTTIIQRKELEIKNLGVSIDIFPIDNLPNNKEKRQKYMNVTKRRMDTIAMQRDLNYRRDISLVEYWKRIIQAKINVVAIVMDMNKLSLRKTDYAAVIPGQYGEREIMRRTEMEKTVPIRFGNKKCLAPLGYKTYLTQLYGKNYMMMPPKTMQKPHHAMEAYWKEG